MQPAEAGDIDEILGLQKRAFHSEAIFYDDFSMPPMTQTHDQMQEEFANRTLLKLTEKGRIVGSVRGHLDPLTYTCHVGRLVIEPNRQGHGLGTRLMQAMDVLFAEAKRFEIFTGAKSLKTIRLYEKLGYLPFKEVSVGSYNLVFMEKLRP